MGIDSGLPVVVGGGAIIRGRRLFKIFLSKRGDYSTEAINRGKAIIRSNRVVSVLKFGLK